MCTSPHASRVLAASIRCFRCPQMLSAAVQGVCDLLGCYRLGKALDPDAVSRALAVYIDEAGQQVLKIRQPNSRIYFVPPHLSQISLSHI